MSKLDPKFHPLLSEEIIETLQSKQIFNVLEFIGNETQQIIKITGLNFKEVLEVKRQLLKQFSATPINGYDYYRLILKNAAIIPTGIKNVDELLEGGLITGHIYEICGLPASGKTQFALNLTANVAVNCKQKVFYLDTKNDFSAKRVVKLSNSSMESLEKILVKRTYTKYELINSLFEIKTMLENDLKLRLIVVDSLPSVLLDTNDYVENNSRLNHLVNVMRYLAVEHHIAFLITNLITTWSDGDFKNVQDFNENIACGKYWFSVPNTRLKIEKVPKSNLATLTVLSSDTLSKIGTSEILDIG